MKKILMFALVASMAVFTACNKDDETFEVPAITLPAAATAEIGNSVDLTFAFTADGGFKSSSVTATNGTAVVTTNGTAGSKSGSVVVTFTAGTQVGAGSVVLTITDNENQTTTGTGVVSVLEEQVIFNIDGNITQNTTWMTGKVYVLKSRIAVVSGVTLTIEPGVIVKGEAGTGANATALLIARGGKLMAEGSASSPIIFTSVADEIMPGEVASPNLDPTLNGLWGGLLILGNAPISADAASIQIEGIPPSDQNGLYGGTDAADNSGVIKYISIRHGGANIGEGNEINGLTLGGVGSGTTIENVEVIAKCVCERAGRPPAPKTAACHAGDCRCLGIVRTGAERRTRCPMAGGPANPHPAAPGPTPEHTSHRTQRHTAPRPDLLAQHPAGRHDVLHQPDSGHRLFHGNTPAHAQPRAGCQPLPHLGGRPGRGVRCLDGWPGHRGGRTALSHPARCLSPCGRVGVHPPGRAWHLDGSGVPPAPAARAGTAGARPAGLPVR